jgi:hypothetical protein
MDKYQLSTYFNNSLFFIAFVMIMMSLQLIALSSNRKGNFEETYFMHILIMMNYIHRMDGRRKFSQPFFLARRI